MIRNYQRNKLIGVMLFLALSVLVQAEPDSLIGKLEIICDVKNKPDHPYYVNFSAYPKQDEHLPIGIFDSGTGGLTVLQAMMRLDVFNNIGRNLGSDGVPDFQNETFTYLGDDANMPYGLYESQGKTDYLKELILKDVLFLLGNRYYQSAMDSLPRQDKKPVKAIVIACNTATAYGYDLIRQTLELWNLPIPVFGVIDGGARSALIDWNSSRQQDVIGVMATEGTCASMGYPQAIHRIYQQITGDTGIMIVQQAGIGLAGAIDQDRNYIDPAAVSIRGKDWYRGPSLNHLQFPIQPELWTAYHFDTTANALLIQSNSSGRMEQIELNSVVNYIHYAVTHLIVQSARTYPRGRLSRIILGCTHYPFYLKEFQKHLAYLRKLNPEYAQILTEDLQLIDPAAATAMELYHFLGQNSLAATAPSDQPTFFISVPNLLQPGIQIDNQGKFTFGYKYQRTINQGILDTKPVPMSEKTLDKAVVQRIRNTMPLLGQLIFSVY